MAIACFYALGTAIVFWSFAIFRMVTGLGIGGEYAAVNSAIDELIPKYRGRIDLVVNGSFWLGAAAGALAVPFLLDLFAPDIGWRLAFGIGAVLGLGILLLRRCRWWPGTSILSGRVAGAGLRRTKWTMLPHRTRE